MQQSAPQAPASDTDELTGSVNTKAIGLDLLLGATLELKTNSSESSECDAVTQQQLKVPVNRIIFQF